jgi:hypothetical protein
MRTVGFLRLHLIRYPEHRSLVRQAAEPRGWFCERSSDSRGEVTMTRLARPSSVRYPVRSAQHLDDIGPGSPQWRVQALRAEVDGGTCVGLIRLLPVNEGC